MDYKQLLSTFEQCDKKISAETLLFSCWNKENVKVHVSRHQKNVLHYSCYNGWKDLAVRLIEEFELDPSFEDHEGNTSLHMACTSGNIDIVKYLIVIRKCDPLQINNVGHAALQIAIKYRHSDMVDYFVNQCGCDQLCEKLGMNVMELLSHHWHEKIARSLICNGGCQVKMKNGTTLLHVFARKGFVLRVRFLVEDCKCDPNLQNHNGNTILHEFYEFFVNLHDADLKHSMNVLEQLILQHKCDPNIENIYGETVLHIVYSSWIRHKYSTTRCKMLFFLIEECAMSPNIQLANTNNTPLNIVCEAVCCSGHNSLILYNLIVQHDCDPFQANGDGLTVLDIAIQHRNRRVVRYLINKCGCDQLCKTMGQQTMQLLYDYWDEEVAKCLICDGGYQLIIENATSLIHEFAGKGFTKRVLFLLNTCGFNPNLQNSYGNTVLHEFCQFIFFTDTNEHLILEQLVLQHKCNPNIENANGETILHTLCYSLLQCGYSASRLYILFFLLRECKMSPHIQLKYTVLNTEESATILQFCEAICENDHNHSSSKFYELIATECKCDPFQTIDDIFTTLSIAIKYCDNMVVSYIVAKCGCHHSLFNRKGIQIMKLIYEFWNEEIADCLIRDGGCHVTMENGTTLLHEFASNGLVSETVFLLDKCKCDPFQTNSKGHTLLDCAIMARNSTLVSYLIKTCGFDRVCIATGERIMILLYHFWDENVAKCLICDGGCQVTMENGTTLLHKFFSIGHVAKVIFLIDMCKCDPFQTNSKGHTVLDCAIMARNSKLVSYLINTCGFDRVCKATGEKIMKLLYDYWDKEVAKCLICDGGCQVTMENGTILLHKFVSRGHVAKVIFLINTCKCDPFQANSKGHTVLDCAIMARNSTLVSYLISTCGFDKACKETGEKIMQLLHDHWDEEVAKRLLCDGGCQVTMANGTTLLHEFVSQKQISRLHYLLSECNCNQNLINKNGNTILHEFLQLLFLDHGSPIASLQLQYLTVDFKCNPNIKNANGETALHIVCNSLLQCGYNEDRCEVLFFLLLELKMSPHVQLKNTNESLLQAVCEAVFHGNHDPSILCYLIVECKCDPHIDKDMLLWTLLRSVILWGAHKPTINVLCYLLAELKIDPHISIGNSNSVCLMCCPIESLKSTLNNRRSLNGKRCLTCKSLHNFSDSATTYFGMDSFVTVINLNVSTSNVEDVAHLLKLLCYFVTFIECKCHFYQTLTQVNIIEKLCFYCLSPEVINDPVCLMALRKLIITSDCQSYISYECLYQLLNCNSKTSSRVLEEVQQHLIKIHPLRIAYSIASRYCLHLFHFINILDLTTTDESGDTVLHIACQYFNGDATLIEYILSTGKADPLCYNNDRQTPMMLLSKRSEDIGAKRKVQQMIHQFGEVKVSHPIESYVNVVVLGNPGVGKSSLVKVIMDRPSSLLGSALGRLRYVTEVDLCTAGIVPHILNDKDLGRIILHDLAGQAEYYSSHTAVLENLLQGSSAVFIVVISLADEMLQESFQFWLTAIENVSCNALSQCHLFVVTSHADLVTRNSASTIDILQKLLSSRLSSSDIIRQNEIIKLDCRKLGGKQLDSLVSFLSSTCKTVIHNSLKKMSIYCHLLYDFFQSDKKVVYQLESLLEIFLERNDLFLPTNVESLVEIVHSLSSTGLIVFLRNKEFPAKSWIVIDKSILLAELNGVLFAPEDFKEYVGIASNTGIIKLSDLSALFPNYDSDLLVKFLQYMELCEVITEEFMNLKLLSVNNAIDNMNDQYIFVPALIKDTEKPQIEEVFTFGWCLRCTNPQDFFLSRFLHLALLQLACKYSKKSSAIKFDRLCKVWTTGIYWKDMKGVQTLVELVDNKKSLVLLTTCQDGAINEMIKLIKKIILEILICKQQVMPKIDTCEFVIDNSHLQYPLKSFKELTLYNIELIAECYINDEKFIVDRTGIKQTPITKLFPQVTADQYYESIFADRYPKNLIAGKFEINISVGTKMYDSVTPVKSNEEHKENPTQVSSTQPGLEESSSIIQSPVEQRMEVSPDRSTRECQSKLFRKYHAEMCEVLVSTSCLECLALDLYSNCIIDEVTKNCVLNEVESLQAANNLLESVKIVFRQNPKKFWHILCIMEEQQILKSIVQNIKQKASLSIESDTHSRVEQSSTILWSLDQEEIEASSKTAHNARKYVSEMFRKCYSQMCKILVTSHSSFKNFTMHLYSSGYIDVHTKQSVLNESKGFRAANNLLGPVKIVLEQSPEKFEHFLWIMEQQKILHHIVHEIRQDAQVKLLISNEMKHGNSTVSEISDEMMQGNSTVLRESDETKQGNSTVLRESDEMMQGISTVLRESDETKQGNSTVLRESDEMKHGNSTVSDEMRHGNSRESDEMKQGNSTMSRESDETKQGNSTVSRESDEMKQGNSTVLGESDEMKQGNSTVSSSVTHNLAASVVLKEHTPVLLGLLSDPDKLSNELWASNLLSDGVRDRIETTSGISRYDKSSMILTEVLRYIKLPESEDAFVRFCNVLKNHGQPGLKEIAEKMISLVTD